MAQVLVLTRRDGSTEVAHIGSPFLAVMFEAAHKGRSAESAADNGWMAYYDLHGEAPPDRDTLLDWLKQFIGTDIADYVPPDPTAATANGTAEPDSSSLT